MQRIIDTTASGSLPSPPALTGTTGYFTEGSPGVTPATRVRSWWANMVQEELLALLTAAAIAPDTSATVFNQVLAAVKVLGPTVVGAARGLAGSAAGGTVTASWTAFELIAETSGGICYKGSSLTLNFNAAGTGAGGMDTGSIPAAGDLSVYAIYNPTTNTWSTLGCTGATSNGPRYTGANMPSGYTASALLWAGVTASSLIKRFQQRDRKIWPLYPVVAFTGGTATTWTSTSLAAGVPAAAVSFSGTMDTSSGTGFFEIAADSLGQIGLQAIGGATGVTNYGNYGPIPLITAQTCWHISATGVSGDFSVSEYEI